MASKRGLVLTAGLLAAITAASFAIWLPGTSTPTLVVSDPGDHLDGIEAVRAVLAESIRSEYGAVLEGAPRGPYEESAQAAARQARGQMAELLSASPPAGWEASYAAQAGAVRALGAYIVETMAAAAEIEAGGPGEAAGRAAGLLEESERLAAEAMALRP
ncbi:MAG: hypothetical protein MPI95_01005 [Nitrosopumilus sp.]|nr:hypothetical protein [Nitrosopumilus sp.]MDA7957658.1 hypothetical protein [Nitrosopumilus sp.]